MKPTPRDVQWLVSQLDDQKRRLKNLENRKPGLAYSSIEDGAIREYDKDGVLGSQTGKQPDGTHGNVVLNGPKPPKPTDPAVTAVPGMLEGRWNGKFDGGVASPLDLKHVAMYAVLAGEVLDLSKQAGVMTGELGDNVQVQVEAGVYNVYLVAWSKAGRFSDAAGPVPVLVPVAADMDAIQAALDDLDERYDGVITEAGNLGVRLDTAETDIAGAEVRLDEAGTRLDTAFGQISAVDGKANEASTAASSAQSKADTAKSAADQAVADALAASGLAAGKGKVLVQSAAPGVADRNAVTLWIDTAGGANTPKRWTTGATWVAVTDKAATDAAAAAATAKSVADAAAAAALAAQQAAGAAQSTADSALTMAGSKSKVFYSDNTPSGTATLNDVWRQRNATKDIIGEWYWDNGWVKTLISSQSISNLDVGKLTVGTGIITDLVAEHIAGRSARFIQLDVSQLVAVTGTMSEAVITKLFTDVVMSRKITAQMLAIGSFDNLIPGAGFTERRAWDGNSRFQIVEGQSESGGPVGRFAGLGTTSSCYETLDGNSVPCVPLSSYRIRGRVRSNVDAPASSVRVMMRFEVGPGAYTYPTAATPALTAGQWTQIDGVITAPANATGRRFALNVQATFPNGAFADFAEVSATRMSGGELVVDGSIKAKHADLESFAADLGFIADLTARIVKADMFVGKEFVGGIFTGATFQTSILPDQGMKLDNAGLRAYGPEGGEPVAEIRPDGGTVYQVSDPVSGEVLGGIGSDGGITGTGLTIEGDAVFDGVMIAGGEPLTEGHRGGDNPGGVGPIFNGRSLFGGTFMNYVEEHPAIVDGNAWMTPLPHGPKVNAWRERTGTDYWDGIGGQNHSRMMLTTTLNAVANRAYLVTWQGPAIREGGTAGQGSLGAAVLRKSVQGGSVAAEQGTPIAGQRIYLPRGGQYFTPGGTTVLRCPEDIDEGKIMFGVDVYVNAGRQAESTTASGANLWSISIVDIGLRSPYNDGVIVDLQKQGTATPTPAPAPAPNPVKQYTDVINATWWQAYLGGGGQATHSTYNGSAAQGRSPYVPGNGVMRGMVGFPSQASRLSGATVKKIEVYVYAKSWHASAGGTICLGVHGAASKPGTWSSITNDVKRQKMKRPEGRWITLPPSEHNGFKSGTVRGITMLPPGSSTSTEYYGIFTGNKTRLRITYTK